MPTEVSGGGYSGDGTSVQPGTGGAQQAFTDIAIAVQTASNAFVAPSDTPARDVERTVEDSTGKRVKWTFRQSTGAWKGVELA